jgi:hypothetical protein
MLAMAVGMSRTWAQENASAIEGRCVRSSDLIDLWLGALQGVRLWLICTVLCYERAGTHQDGVVTGRVPLRAWCSTD